MFDFDRLRYLERGMRLRWDTDEGAAVEKEVLKLVVVLIVVAVVLTVVAVLVVVLCCCFKSILHSYFREAEIQCWHMTIGKRPGLWKNLRE